MAPCYPRVAEAPLIRLSVPGTLEFRDVAMRVVASACKLLRPAGGADARADEFDHQVVSAFGEAYNNVAIHGYRGVAPGDVTVELEAASDELVIRLLDRGRSYEMPDRAATPDELPERGMGLYIIQSFMDRVEYTPGRDTGADNTLLMSKRWEPPAE
jgi:serine/threonine-protein kinase RsbW